VQVYIDQGLVTWIPWPPKTNPPPFHARTKLEDWQENWFRDSLDTCLSNDWPIHRQGPCQLAAFLDAIRKTKDGVSRWLGIWDVDEYIFPKPGCGHETMTDLLMAHFSNYTHLMLHGMVFGTNGHVTPPVRKEGDELQPLLTEEYTYRAAFSRSFIPLHD